MPQMLKIWAYDRPGVLDRVAGLIRRKGWNIHTLVAADVDDGLSQIDIALVGRNVNIHVLGDYLSEMDVIQGFEECTNDSHILREMLLFCLHDDGRELAGEHGAELLDKIGRARLVEQRGDLRYLEYSGPPREVNELLVALRARKIRCARTGALALASSDILTEEGADAYAKN